MKKTSKNLISIRGQFLYSKDKTRGIAQEIKAEHD